MLLPLIVTVTQPSHSDGRKHSASRLIYLNAVSACNGVFATVRIIHAHTLSKSSAQLPIRGRVSLDRESTEVPCISGTSNCSPRILVVQSLLTAVWPLTTTQPSATNAQWMGYSMAYHLSQYPASCLKMGSTSITYQECTQSHEDSQLPVSSMNHNHLCAHCALADTEGALLATDSPSRPPSNMVLLARSLCSTNAGKKKHTTFFAGMFVPGYTMHINVSFP